MGRDLHAWQLAWTTSISVPGGADARSGRFELGLPRPNPSRSETMLEFELEVPSRVVIDVFNAQGRRVRRIADGFFVAGRHTSMWRGDGEGGQQGPDLIQPGARRACPRARSYLPRCPAQFSS